MIKPVKRILKVFADNNLFNEGVELIGSWCFQLYQRHLGAKSFPLRTQDIDVEMDEVLKVDKKDDGFVVSTKGNKKFETISFCPLRLSRRGCGRLCLTGVIPALQSRRMAMSL